MADPDDPKLRAGPPVPAGIQKVLVLASRDEAFRLALMERSLDAVGDAGIQMTPSECSVLAAVTKEQLSEMIASLPTSSDSPDERLAERFLVLGITADAPARPHHLQPSRGLSSALPISPDNPGCMRAAILLLALGLVAAIGYAIFAYVF